ncbi:MAG: SGNH/GDSL hydrolase family protein [Pseudomonadota bacterium]
MMHIVLLGDSIFDNGAYVPDGPPVRDQLASVMPGDASVTLLAVDGDLSTHVPGQLRELPKDATHLVVSCGGNDALGFLPEFIKPVSTIADAMVRFGELRGVFRERYRGMLDAVTSQGLPVFACSVYEQVPNIGGAERAALSMFNEIIFQECQGRVNGIIDLRVICGDAEDYSEVSPIEPSERGGKKIVQAIRAAVLGDASHVVTPVIGPVHQ